MSTNGITQSSVILTALLYSYCYEQWDNASILGQHFRDKYG